MSNKEKAGVTMQGITSNGGNGQARTTSPKRRKPSAFILKLAGRNHLWSKLTHYGRKTGQAYTTVLSAYPLGDGFVMAMLYGTSANVDWCRNILSTGRCILKTGGKVYELERPELLTAAQALEYFPPLLKRMYKSRGLNEFLWVHTKRG